MKMPLFRGMKPKRLGIAVAALLLSSVLLAACGESSPSTLNPVGPVADKELGLFWFILAVATIVFVIVEGWLIYSIVRYRARPGMPAPPQIHGNNTVEAAWTIAPALFLFAVLVYTIYTMFTLAPTANLPGTPALAGGKPTLEVRVYGHQWWWEFDYTKSPNYGFVTADSLHIPVGTVVRVDLYSDNVIHSFWIPQITGKTDVVPGHDNYMIFRADKVGNYLGECAEFCGTQHAHMNFDVVVEPMDTFQTWVSTQQAAAATPPAGLAAQGEQLFKTSQCAGCHGIVGVNLTGYNDPKAAALIGPDLTHFGSRDLIAGGVLDNNAAQCEADLQSNPTNPDLSNCQLAQWLNDPQGIKPGSDMVISPLTKAQINELVAYLESLK